LKFKKRAWNIKNITNSRNGKAPLKVSSAAVSKADLGVVLSETSSQSNLLKSTRLYIHPNGTVQAYDAQESTFNPITPERCNLVKP
jgi:hypothetical protein